MKYVFFCAAQLNFDLKLTSDAKIQPAATGREDSFIGFLVESKSEIRFRMASFSFSPSSVMRKRVAKSEAILAFLDTFQELHLEW